MNSIRNVFLVNYLYIQGSEFSQIGILLRTLLFRDQVSFLEILLGD